MENDEGPTGPYCRPVSVSFAEIDGGGPRDGERVVVMQFEREDGFPSGKVFMSVDDALHLSRNINQVVQRGLDIMEAETRS